MGDLSDIVPLVMELPEKDRARLAAHLLPSLPPVLDDETEEFPKR